MDRTIAEVLSATIGGYFTNWWEHPTFCVIIDESHIAVTQNIGCSLINLFKADSQFQMDIDHCFFGQLDNVCTARLIYFADAENITVAWYFFDRFSL